MLVVAWTYTGIPPTNIEHGSDFESLHVSDHPSASALAADPNCRYCCAACRYCCELQQTSVTPRQSVITTSHATSRLSSGYPNHVACCAQL